MKATRTVSWVLGNGKKAECKIEVSREVVTEIAYADGQNIELGKSPKITVNTVLTVDGVVKGRSTDAPTILSAKYDAKMVKAGAFARLGDLYVAEAQYELVMAAIAECSKEVSNQVEVVQTVKLAGNVVVVDDGAVSVDAEYRGAGWCNKCHTYCYGDCEAN